MANKQSITQALLQLKHLPNCPITDDNVSQIVEQYTSDMIDIPDEVVGAAVIYYRTNPNPFFPTSGQLRDKAIELLLMAMNVPTASHAWAQLLSAVRFLDSEMCPECERLFRAVDGLTGGDYWDAIHAYQKHTGTCEVYSRGGFKEVYDHPIVEEIVFEMGGRDRLLEGDIGVCRSLFLKGYTEIVTRKIKRASLPVPVREVVGRIADVQGKIKMLAEGFEK